VSDYSLFTMTEKQENILLTALEMFATQGYHAVSTSKIARQAGVSEALIFRHFENKEGLLQAIMKQAEEKTRQVFADIVMTTDAREVISKTLTLPFVVPKEEYKVWRLMYALKWQTNSYNPEKMQPLRLALSNAFKKLGYKQPETEAEILLMLLDGVVTAMLLHEPEHKEQLLNTLKAKYNI